MGKEILAIPEDYVMEVVTVLREGLKATKDNKAVTLETRRQVAKWCREQEAYVKGQRRRDE